MSATTKRHPRRAATRANQAVYGETLIQRLFLLRWLHAQFGFLTSTNDLTGDAATKQLLEMLREAREGFDGLSYIAQILLAHACPPRKISDSSLRAYDDNVRHHLYAINENRSEQITLRYFQHLALLYTEHLLDRLFSGPEQLCAELNQFVRDTMLTGARECPRFTPVSLRKLAFMMATGSGKTLLLHLNYRQFLSYNGKRPIANILLVTPNKDLSAQHERELRESGIPCRRFEANRARDLIDDPHTVEIIEITRFVPEKKDRGKRVEPEQFSGRNLVFVDEGHKSKSEEGVGRDIRNRLVGDEGFVFEYSATFQQAFAGDDVTAQSLRDEYGAAILFDYSYRWFLHDGFGKDFTVLNSRGTDEEIGTWSLLAGLFVFAAQVHAYQNNSATLSAYNIAHPLALMVGSNVAGSSKQDEETKSDVLRTLRFFHKFLRNDEGWSVARLTELITETTPLDDQGIGRSLKQARDYFKTEMFDEGRAIFDFIVAKLFHSPGGGGLVVHRIKGNDNEIALRASEAGGAEPFGLVYIGKASDLSALIKTTHGIEQSDDAMNDAWFPTIDQSGSPIQFLIGAKMFIEGWSSWRVSAMGLINIGKSEGSEIIQLFGRGVRLLGLNRGLKRSSHVTGTHPKFLPLLERLFIFAIDSRYMEKFREKLDLEGVDGSGFLEYELELWRTIDHEKLPDLHVPEWPGEMAFRERAAALFDRSYLGTAPSRRQIKIKREFKFRAQASDAFFEGAGVTLPEKKFSECTWGRMVDREALYLRLVSHARERRFENLALSVSSLRDFLDKHANDLIIQAGEEFHRPLTWSDFQRLEDAVFDLLKAALERVFRRAQQTWETQNMTVPKLQKDHANYKFTYRIRMPQKLAATSPAFVQQLQTLIASCPKANWTGAEALSAIAKFGDHLYQPLLVDADLTYNQTVPNRAEQLQLAISPALLTESEQRFVEDLREYWVTNKDTVHPGERIFLLRNLSRGKGVGFFESEGFYPDFILWHVLADERQHLVFLEPHGMRQEDAPEISNKVRIAREIQDYLRPIFVAAKCPISDVTGFIISTVPFEELARKHGQQWTMQRYAEHHILFPETIRTAPNFGGILSTK